MREYFNCRARASVTQQGSLPQPRHAFQQHVSGCQKTNEYTFYDVVLPDNNFGYAKT